MYWDARFGLAKSYYEQGELGSARDHFRAVRQEHPNKFVRGDALFSLAEIAILMNRTIRAERFLETFIEVFPEHVLIPTAKKQLRVLKEVDRATPPANLPGVRNGSRGSSGTSDSPENPRLKSAESPKKSPRSIIDPLKSDSSDTSSENKKKDKSTTIKPSIKMDRPDTGTTKSQLRTPNSTTSASTQSRGRISPFAGADDMGLGADTPTDSTEPKRTSGTHRSPDTFSKSGPQSPPDRAPKTSLTDTKVPSKPNLDSDVSTRKEKQSDTKSAVTTSGETPVEQEDTSVKTSRTGTSGTTGKTGKKQSPIGQGDSSDPVSKTQSENGGKVIDSSGKTLKRARKFFEQGKYTQAEKLVDSLLVDNPASPEPYRLAAEITQQQGGSSEEVLSYLNQALERVDGTSIPLNLMKAKVLIEKNRYKQALSSLNRLDPSGMTDPKRKAHYHYLRGTIALERGNSDESFFDFMDAVRAAPSSEWADRARTTINTSL
jgi:tetratricopeptide (TPR) repeat protein